MENQDSKTGFAASALLAAFMEESEWIEAECAAMEAKPESYCADDRIGLPYMRTIMRSVKDRAAKSEAANARADLPPASDAARDSGTESANGG